MLDAIIMAMAILIVVSFMVGERMRGFVLSVTFVVDSSILNW